MSLTALADFYMPHNAVAWAAWDPDFSHRKKSNAESWEVIAIDEAAKKYQVKPETRKFLDEIITEEVYQQLICQESIAELKQQGFVILKDWKTNRVLYHRDQPDWIIKVSLKAKRYLPLEGPYKVKKGLASEIPKKEVWRPLRNTNLLRAAGRDYFVGQLQDLEAEDREFFDFAEEYIYHSLHAPPDAPMHQKYFSIAKRKNTYSGSETVELIQDQEVEVQREIANKFIKIIKNTRIHDWHAENVLLSKEVARWRFDFIDSEPLGILIDSEDNGAHLLDPKEQVLFGLISFRDWYCRDNGLTVMAEEVDRAIVDYLSDNEHIETKVQTQDNFYDPASMTACQTARMVALIIVSIFCPLVPLILLIVALFKSCCCPDQHPTDRFEHVDFEGTPGRLAYPIS
jgi:hypothetical protein